MLILRCFLAHAGSVIELISCRLFLYKFANLPFDLTAGLKICRLCRSLDSKEVTVRLVPRLKQNCQQNKKRYHIGTKHTLSALSFAAWRTAKCFYRMFLSYQGDSAVLCEAFVLFTTSVIGTVPQEICCGMCWSGDIFLIA